MVQRRRFDHLVLELSLALGEAIPRYPLWLRLHEAGLDPERLTQEDVLEFCTSGLGEFLSAGGRRLPAQRRRRLLRAVRSYDPSITTPEEHFARLN